MSDEITPDQNAALEANIKGAIEPVQAAALKESEKAENFMLEAKAVADAEKEKLKMKEEFEKNISAMKEEIMKNSAVMTHSEFLLEKEEMQKQNALLTSELTNLKNEFSALKEILMRAKAQGKATIPTEKDATDAEFNRVFGDILGR